VSQLEDKEEKGRGQAPDSTDGYSHVGGSTHVAVEDEGDKGEKTARHRNHSSDDCKCVEPRFDQQFHTPKCMSPFYMGRAGLEPATDGL
jgi:hypothetical protein